MSLRNALVGHPTWLETKIQQKKRLISKKKMWGFWPLYTRIEPLCGAALQALSDCPLLAGSVSDYSNTLWLQIASRNLPNSQLSWESKMEPSVAIIVGQKQDSKNLGQTKILVRQTFGNFFNTTIFLVRKCLFKKNIYLCYFYNVHLCLD